MSEFFKLVGLFIGVVALIIFIIYLTVFIGYIFGMLLAILPWIGDVLTEGTPLSKSDLPKVGAWIGVIAVFLGSSVKFNRGSSE